MEDSLEDEVLYQTYISHMKLVSKFAVALPLNIAPLNYVWRMLRVYMFKPEVLIFSALLCLIFFYLQAVDVWSRSLFNRLQCSIGLSTSKVSRLQFLVNSSGGEDLSWDAKGQNAAVYAIQGRRPHMEDRFVIFEDIENTDISLFAIYDGHGGEFAADYAKDKLTENLRAKIVEVKQLQDKPAESKPENEGEGNEDTKNATSLERKPSERSKEQDQPVRKPVERKESNKGRPGSTDDLGGPGNKLKVTDPLLLSQLRARQGVTRDVQSGLAILNKLRTPVHPSKYLSGNKIDFGTLITDEVLAADELLVAQAKKSFDVAGSTALIAVIEGTRLVVANVGDSRGRKERQRITQAGGFVTFNGVWRVAGILATSRALGDYPLKDKRLIVAEPDILTFDLSDHCPQFLILATDGLWDAFSNEEAVAFIKERLSEPYYGAKSITLQAFHKGSLDNISVIVVSFKNSQWAKK
ncbi:hypothetical protein B566_EDAN003115 [Ephemera danica]|nr:hypothetical protein B566_EDAN003115 [Ephemera danica]